MGLRGVGWWGWGEWGGWGGGVLGGGWVGVGFGQPVGIQRPCCQPHAGASGWFSLSSWGCQGKGNSPQTRGNGCVMVCLLFFRVPLLGGFKGQPKGQQPCWGGYSRKTCPNKASNHQEHPAKATVLEDCWRLRKHLALGRQKAEMRWNPKPYFVIYIYAYVHVAMNFFRGL